MRDDYSRTRHRLESLKELDDRRAYYSGAVQMMFSEESAPRDFHFIGTLADALNVEAKWERAVEGVLGSSLQSIVVPTPDDAARAAQWLRENGGGRASFLVAGLHGGSEETNALACKVEERRALSISFEDETVAEGLKISDLLGAPRELLSVLQRTLPEKMNARLARNLDEAMTKSLATGEVFVTLNGDWVASGQFVSAGDARALEEGAGLLTFKRELRELEARAGVLASEAKAAEAAAAQARERLVGLEDAVVLLNEAIGREEREAMAREVTATGLAHEIERAERHMRVVADDAARVEQERLEVERRRAAAINDAEEAEAARLAATNSVTSATSLLAEARRTAEIESEGLAIQRAAAAAATERRRGTAAELRRMESEYADVAGRIERHRLELVEMTEQISSLRESISDLEYKASTVAEEREREEQQIAELTAQLEAARQQADILATELSNLNRHAAEVRDQRAEIEVQRAEAQARLTFVRENCASELNQSLEDLAREQTIDAEFDLDSAHARVEELRTRIEGFGAVNMM
ncbi:MAG TPA: hypothetical protein VGW32_00085, partial [Pyrinomonadaceae bacterium]|nr:hypothetical protein [Pyrinomonadaceae bacterium]